jgi:acyl-CoA reductase-like NAD-dependent aldehyde dehydrogenase
MDQESLLSRLGISEDPLPAGGHDGAAPFASGPVIESVCPSTGRPWARSRLAGREDCERAIAAAHAAFPEWRETPAHRRGEVLRRIGAELRRRKADLARLAPNLAP